MIRTFTRRGWLLIAALAAGGMTPLLFGPSSKLLLVNESASLPQGLYLRRPNARLTRGAVVAVRQPQAVRAYLSRLGAPADMPLIKRAGALGGDVVCHEGDKTSVADVRVTTLLSDRRGTALPVWADCRRLEDDEVFLLGDTAASFDSRYFGPVRRVDLLGVYQRVGR